MGSCAHVASGCVGCRSGQGSLWCWDLAPQLLSLSLPHQPPCFPLTAPSHHPQIRSLLASEVLELVVIKIKTDDAARVVELLADADADGTLAALLRLLGGKIGTATYTAYDAEVRLLWKGGRVWIGGMKAVACQGLVHLHCSSLCSLTLCSPHQNREISSGLALCPAASLSPPRACHRLRLRHPELSSASPSLLCSR